MNRFVYLNDVVTLRFFEEKCRSCLRCLEVCPRGVFKSNGGRVEVACRDACMECGACVRNCAAGAVTVIAGVGCANAVINSLMGRKSACCCLEETGATGRDGDCRPCC